MEVVRIAKIAGKLKRIKCAGWVAHGVINAESVAEHSYRVAFLSILLAERFNVNPLKVVKMALIHDIGEAVTGDVVWEKGADVAGSREDKYRDEKKAMEEIFGKETLGEYLILWEEFEEQKTDEARFLKALDKFEMALQALEYQEEWNSAENMQLFWDNSEKYLKEGVLNDLFKTLQSLRTD